MAKAGVYFDDFKVTHTKTNVIQYNACPPKPRRRRKYYPFGLQTENSWTRENSSNKFLYNGGSELNANTGWYETFFRGYDAALGRFHQVDPLAGALASYSPYNYAFNNPVMFNDPNGDYPENTYHPMMFDWDGAGGGSAYPSFGAHQYGQYRAGPGSGNHWSDHYGTVERNARVMTTGMFNSWYGVKTDRDRMDVASRSFAAAGEAAEFLGNVAADFLGGILSPNGQYIEIPNYELISEDATHERYRQIASTWIPIAQQGDDGLWSGFASGDGFGLQYSEGLNKTLSTLGGVAGAFESGAAIGTFQRMSKLAFSTAKAGLKMARGLGAAGGVLTLAVAGHEVLTGNADTHTWVNVGVAAVGIGATVVFGTVALPAVAIGGLAYGIWSLAGGSDWIDRKWGYRDPK